MLPFHPIENPIISLEKDHRETTRTISIQNIGSSGTSTGITNSVRKNETINKPMVDSTSSTTKTVAKKREEEDIIQQSGIVLAESQFYVRSSNTPNLKRHDFNEKKETIDNFNKVIPTNLYEEKKVIQNQELFINEPIGN